MRLYDNDAYREDFMKLVYGLLNSDGTNDRANQIVDAFDMAPEVEAEPLPPNDPLTLEELREMDGEPVWVVNSPTKREEGFFDEWALVSVRRKNAESVGTIYHFENYGDHWLAYRRKPEEGTT